MAFNGHVVFKSVCLLMNIVTQDGKYFTRIIHFNESGHNNKYYSSSGFKYIYVW